MRRSPGDTCGVCVYCDGSLCRRNAPPAFVAGNPDYQPRADWPYVHTGSDWCGEFERAPSVKVGPPPNPSRPSRGGP